MKSWSYRCPECGTYQQDWRLPPSTPRCANCHKPVALHVKPNVCVTPLTRIGRHEFFTLKGPSR